MAIVEVSIVPLGTPTPSVSKYVAKAAQVLEGEKDITYELTAMGTRRCTKLSLMLVQCEC